MSGVSSEAYINVGERELWRALNSAASSPVAYQRVCLLTSRAGWRGSTRVSIIGWMKMKMVDTFPFELITGVLTVYKASHMNMGRHEYQL